jgi:hypothetical protein
MMALLEPGFKHVYFKACNRNFLSGYFLLVTDFLSGCTSRPYSLASLAIGAANNQVLTCEQYCLEVLPC